MILIGLLYNDFVAQLASNTKAQAVLSLILLNPSLLRKPH